VIFKNNQISVRQPKGLLRELADKISNTGINILRILDFDYWNLFGI